jgi:hypothetical protein
MSKHKQALGKWGEEFASKYLSEKGFQINEKDEAIWQPRRGNNYQKVTTYDRLG